jgi:carbonic anhydrase
MEPRITPAEAWRRMKLGNDRFIEGAPAHPRQDIDHRESLAIAQAPDVALFGCSDSRLSAEIIFDKGLGDLFVVRNAGQIISDSVLGSLEYAVDVLGVALIVVLGHDNCGAVLGAIGTLSPDAPRLPASVRKMVAPIRPAIQRVAREQGVETHEVDVNEVGAEHLKDTISELLQQSEVITDAVANGTLAVVGANYRLNDGHVVPDVVVGAIN